MGRLLKGLGILLGGILAGAVILSIVARFSDGPMWSCMIGSPVRSS